MFRAGSIFSAVATRHPKYIADVKVGRSWVFARRLNERGGLRLAGPSSIGRANRRWIPIVSKMEIHFRLNTTVKVFRVERFADFKKQKKCRKAEIVVLCLPAV